MLRKKASTGYVMDMCSGSILKKILLFSIPLMCSSVLQLLFNAADIIVVGKFAGDHSLAAVGSTTSLVLLMTNLFTGIAVGGNVLAARYFGAQREEDLTETVHTSMALGLVSGIFLTFVGCILAPEILVWMQTPEEILGLAALYLRIYFVGMTSVMVYNFGSAILRAVGDTQRPLHYLLFSGVVNVVLNLFFVIVFKMDVAGVALATAISQTLSAILIVRCLIRETSGIHLELKEIRFHKQKVKLILKIGLPAGIQGTLFSFSNTVIQSSINGFGAVVVAGSAAAFNLESFIYVAMNALYQAAISFTSQNFGAGKLSRIIKILFTTEICVVVTGLAMGGGAVLFAPQLLGLYTSSPDVIAAGIQRLSIVATFYVLCGMMDVMVGMLRGLGCTIMPMIVSLIGACGLRVLGVLVLFRIERFHKITTIYYMYPITWIITFLTHVVCFCLVWRKVKHEWAKSGKAVLSGNT